MKKIIYILPGWTYNTQRWTSLINLLEESGFEIHKLKIPGLESPIDKTWSIKDYTEWLDEKIKNEKNEIVLMGHSNGGRIATSYVLNNPGKISHLILIGSAGLIDNSILKKFKINTFKSVAKIGKSLHLPSLTKKILYKIARENDYHKANPVLKETMKNLIKVDLEKDLGKIEIPTTIIWGEKDNTTPLKFATIFNSGIKNSKLFIVKNAKHSPQYTHALKVKEIIKTVIK